MPDGKIAIKHNNHRIHPCPESKKTELLNLLISQNKELNIIVIGSDTQELQNGIENKNISILNAQKFLESKDLTCEMLITNDVPDKALIYISMVAKATQKAVLLVDKSEQKMLYPIEILLGRNIKQEQIQGFEYAEKKIEKAPSFEKKPEKFEKTKKKPNKYLGRDENGKAIFSGKSGERNHYFDGTSKEKNQSVKKTAGKKIQIKSLKKPKER